MRLPTLLLPLLLGAALAAPAPTSVQPGQTWTLSATTFDGEVLSTALHLNAAPPAPTAPGTYRADRGSLLLDATADTLIALDLKDAREGGLGLACALRLSTLGQPGATGVLESSKLASGMNESWRSPDRVEINGSAASFSFTTGTWNELQHGVLEIGRAHV